MAWQPAPACANDALADIEGGTSWRHIHEYGREIGVLERPGAIAADGTAPGCIGSSNGGECFQGSLDDVRIYEDALTAEEITLLWRNGQEALAALSTTIAADEPDPIITTTSVASGAPT